MSQRDRWDARHLTGAAPAAPSAFVADQLQTLVRPRATGRALDLACGSGRHSILLGEKGFDVVAVDWSHAACERLASTARIRTVVADALALPFRPSSFTVIVQTCFLEREIFPQLAALLVRGGTLIVETFLVAQFERTGHPRREFCLEPGELRRLCTAPPVGLAVTAFREGCVRTVSGEAFLASLVARKQ